MGYVPETGHYEIRPPRPDECRQVESVVGAAFGESGTSVVNLVERLRKLWMAGRGFELVSSVEGEIVGHVGFTRGYLDAPDQLHHVLVLSPLAVRPDAQGHGVGSALVLAGVEEAARQGFQLVFLEGSPVFYPRLGFVRGGEAGFGKPSVRIPDAAFQVRHLTPEAKVLTGALIYPEVFWETDTVGLRE